jgi:ABC-type transporter Mla subunit MlaD
MNDLNNTLLMVFVGITGLAVLMQAFVMLAIFITSRKTAKAVEAALEDLRDTLVPIAPLVRNARNTLDRISPQVEVAVNNLVAITEDLRVQSSDVHTSATEMIVRLKQQANRVDTMLSGVLDSVESTAGFLRNAVSLPARQLGGILAALKAIGNSLRGVEQPEHPEYADKDSDIFV